jgi:tetratricopeptide (TPR) repeat protein
MIARVNAKGFANARLDTWKSIAQYLGRSTRTVQRWRLEYGLPTRRLGGDATSVFAYTDELDEWLRNRNQRELPADFDRLESNQSHDDPLSDSVSIDQSLVPAIVHRTSGPDERRASELIALAERTWECLSESNLCSIARIYREASDLDPSNAKAFAGLSLALIAAGVLGALHTSDAYPPATAACQRALELDEDLIETRCAAAWLKLLVARDWTGAGITFNEVLLERPQCTQALVGLALLNIAEGRLTQASELLREVAIHRPLNTSATTLLCWQEYLAGNFETALAFVSQARAKGHAGAILDAVEALASVLLKGPEANSERLSLLFEGSPHHYAQRGVLGYVRGMTGQVGQACEILDSMIVVGIQGKYEYAYSMALTFLGMNEPKEAMGWLEQSYIQGSLWSLGFRLDPILAPLRDDPQFGEWFDRMVYPATPLSIG